MCSLDARNRSHPDHPTSQKHDASWMECRGTRCALLQRVATRAVGGSLAVRPQDGG